MVSNVNGNYLNYTVQQGDNLTKIAKKYNTTIAAILQLNPNKKINDIIYAGDNFIIPDNSNFEQREDYSPNNMNMNSVTVGGETVEGFDKSNYYVNNLGNIAKYTINDGNPASRVEILIQAGKSMIRKDNDTPFSLLNKAIGDHINNNSTVIKDNDNKFHTKNQWLEQTHLYQAFISEDVNGDNFMGENNKLLNRGNSGNKVQFPSIEIDSNGTKYFTLQGNSKTYYFDETGKEVQFYHGIIIGATQTDSTPNPKPTENNKPAATPQTEDFEFSDKHGDKILNLGNIYVNGNKVEKPQNANANFFANNINMFVEATLNDENATSRLDVQLNAGNLINERDLNADDLLKKMLGTNWDKSSNIEIGESNQAQAIVPSLKGTQMYNEFIRVNEANFVDGKLKKGVTCNIQFPALEVDSNGIKYFTLHTDNGILYFNDKGEELKINQ